MAVTEDTRVTFDPIKLAQQKKYLDLLAVFHYVVAGLAFMISLVFLIHIGLGGVMLVNPTAFDGTDEPPAFLGCFIAGMGGLLLLGF